MFKNIRWNTVAVVLFVLSLIALFISEDAHGAVGDWSITTGVAGGVVHYSGGVTQTIGVLSPEKKWYAEYERQGGKEWSRVHAVSVSRVVWLRPEQKGLHLSLGATKSSGTLVESGPGNKPLVSEDLSYRLGIGYSWTLSPATAIRLGVIHNSTAGRSDRNHGIDRIHLAFDWRL